jgi:20S proteasome alpha/beta subunit
MLLEDIVTDPDKKDILRQALGGIQMPIAIEAMALQDCVDLAIFFIRTTISAQRLTVGIRGVGGPIDVAVITKEEDLRFVQKKKITGEAKDI